MGLIFKGRLQAENVELREENIGLRKEVNYWMKKCFEVADAGAISANELKKYRSLGSIEYFQKLVESEKR